MARRFDNYRFKYGTPHDLISVYNIYNNIENVNIRVGEKNVKNIKVRGKKKPDRFRNNEEKEKILL